MRSFILFLLLTFFLALLTSCSRTTAGVTIPARQTFVLGEYMDDAYTAKLDNRGDQTVTVELIGKTDGQTSSSLKLAGGEGTTLSVEPDFLVHLKNTSETDADVAVVMSKNVPGMRYIDPNEVKDPAADQPDNRVFTAAPDAGPAHESVKMAIPAGQQLVVGEGTTASYSAKISSNREISVSVRDKHTGQQTQGFGMRGVQRINVRRHEDIYLVNDGRKDATVSLRMSMPVAGKRLEKQQ